MILLVTGGCGFIGSHFVRMLCDHKLVDQVVVVDNLTYASNPNVLPDSHRCTFIKADIADKEAMRDAFKKHQFDGVINFAAETHVDRSIDVPLQFVQTNVVGTAVLLECAVAFWKNHPMRRFHQISTDEVYGSLNDGEPAWHEGSSKHPSTPYSATKASAEELALAYGRTFGVNAIVTRCSNNYGTHQHDEKFIPKAISCIRAGKPVPIHGKGDHVRDWIHVADHCLGIWKAFNRARSGHVYNIGGQSEMTTLELTEQIYKHVNKHRGSYRLDIEHVDDRPGNDHRYAMDISKSKWELKWQPTTPFDSGLRDVVDWYIKERC